jgi:NAD(P)H dehydrogenase (quinone)
MNILILFCHPEPQSFNGTLRDVAKNTFEKLGHNVEVSDLYAEGFNAVEKPEHYKNRIGLDRFDPLSEQRNAFETDSLLDDVKREIERLKKCDLLILQFPMWWHQQPAMIKGWCDRVFVSGGLYTSKMRYDKGFFKGKRAICSVTSDAPTETFTEKGRGGGEIEVLLRSLNFSLHYMGFLVLPPFLSTEIQNADYTYMASDEFELHLQKTKQKWEEHLTNIDEVKPLSFPSWDDWGEKGVAID